MKTKRLLKLKFFAMLKASWITWRSMLLIAFGSYYVYYIHFRHPVTVQLTIDQWMDKIEKPPNVLFIIADDLRSEIQAQRHRNAPWINPSIQTPSLDDLASNSLLFRRAYCQISWCNPSRTSLLTSRRPDSTMVHNNSAFFRVMHPDIVTLPEYFKNNGYFTAGLGKIYHLSAASGCEDNAKSWSVPMLRIPDGDITHDGKRAWGVVDDDSKPLQDEYVLEKAKNMITNIKSVSEGKPFFVAVGFKKPHMDWYFPKRFLKPYTDEESWPNPLKMETDMPEVAWQSSYEVCFKKEYAESVGNWSAYSTAPADITQELRRAYFSCVSYIDELVGDLINHVKSEGLWDNTIIVFVGDHGFHLGEHGIFGKNTAFEIANNVPLMLRVPGVTDTGRISDELVELVDIFPTLAELAGLPALRHCAAGGRVEGACSEGASLVPLLRPKYKWKDRVFYQYPHLKPGNYIYCMGYTIRTGQYRYTEWIEYYYKLTKNQAQWDKSCGVELYDHSVDPSESENLAENENMKEVKATLREQLKKGWRHAVIAQ